MARNAKRPVNALRCFYVYITENSSRVLVVVWHYTAAHAFQRLASAGIHVKRYHIGWSRRNNEKFPQVKGAIFRLYGKKEMEDFAVGFGTSTTSETSAADLI